VKLAKKDLLATLCVGAGAVVYLLWLLGVGWSGAPGVRLVAAVVLVLGFAASASAVVPGFGDLMHGSKAYMAGASLFGAGALAAGLIALLQASSLALGLLVGANLLLWAGSTARHTLAANRVQPGGPGPSLGSPIAV
jgi:hypothetical protein